MSRSRPSRGSNNQFLLCQQEAKAFGKALERELAGTQDRSFKRQATHSRATQPQATRLPTFEQTSSSLLADSLLGRDLPAEHPLATSLLQRDVLAKSLLAGSRLRRNKLAEDLLAEGLLAKSAVEELVRRDQPARDLLATSLPTTTPPVLQCQPMLLR